MTKKLLDLLQIEKALSLSCSKKGFHDLSNGTSDEASTASLLRCGRSMCLRVLAPHPLLACPHWRTSPRHRLCSLLPPLGRLVPSHPPPIPLRPCCQRRMPHSLLSSEGRRHLDASAHKQGHRHSCRHCKEVVVSSLQFSLPFPQVSLCWGSLTS